MKNLNKLAALVAFSALASLASAQTIDNWRNANGDVWKNASGDCWRNASWTPATAAPGCGPAPAPAPVAALQYSAAEIEPSAAGGTSKNALCPCGSGKKYKRCHGQS